MTIALTGKPELGTDAGDAAQKTLGNIGLRSDGELVQAGVCGFDPVATGSAGVETAGFLAPAVCSARIGGRRADTDDGDAAKAISTAPEEFEAHEDTPYDDDVPKEFRIAEPPPPPFDKGEDDDSLPDTITWTNVGDGSVDTKAEGSVDFDDFLPLESFGHASTAATNCDGPPYLDVNGDTFLFATRDDADLNSADIAMDACMSKATDDVGPPHVTLPDVADDGVDVIAPEVIDDFAWA